jgi:hypothetical protein
VATWKEVVYARLVKIVRRASSGLNVERNPVDEVPLQNGDILAAGEGTTLLHPFRLS